MRIPSTARNGNMIRRSVLSQKADKYTNTVGRTVIYACGESVSRHNSSELVVLFSLKQEASASIGGGTFTK